ncbi:MAG: helix-turn-helix transcriptional regulator [Oceanicaulis sp.]
MVIDLREAKDTEWLNRLSVDPAQYIVTPQLGLLGANMSGEALLRQERCVKLVDGQVRAVKRAFEPLLNELIGSASQKGYRTIMRCPEDGADLKWVASSRILLRTKDGSQTILFALRPLIKSEPMSGADAMSLFGLTPAEARLAVEMAAGHSLAEISDKRGTHISTLRAQLRSIYQKTGISKQSEFVSAIWRASAI